MKKIFLLLALLPVFSFKTFTTDADIFMGDSITFGNELGALQYTARWPTQYCNDIATYEVNQALSGAAMTPGLNAGRPVFDIASVPGYNSSCRNIFVNYWVNDYLYGGTVASYVAATRVAVDGIIAKGWPAAKIVLCFNYIPESPGTWIDMTHAKAQQWLAGLRSVQQAKGTSFLDFYTLIYNRPDKATYSGDLIHPTAAWNTIMKQYTQTNIEGPSTTLPVTFAGFSGQRQGGTNLLKWTVAQEQNVMRYEITRSEDGIAWTRAGEVATPGNTALQHSYSFADNTPGAGRQLYRLKAVDADGAVKLSNIVVVSGSKGASLSLGGLFPNPASSKLNVVVNAPAKEDVTVSLLDALGRPVKSRKEVIEAGASTLDLNVSDVRAGVYYIQLLSGTSGTPLVERFVKE